MAISEVIYVMISSRNSDAYLFEGEAQPLTALRRRIKEELEREILFEGQLFEVWINEDEPPTPGTEDAWEWCMRQVRRAHIVLALYNGRAGWIKHDGEIGICHGELQAALEEAPGKTRIVRLDPFDDTPDLHDKRFRDYMERKSRVYGIAKNGEEVIDLCRRALRQSVVDMVDLGLRESRRGKFYSGPALDWSRLDYNQRRQVMQETVIDALLERRDAEKLDDGVALAIGGKSVAIKCDAVPAAMTVASARELVGQPQLRDHEYLDTMEDCAGPIHLIACHRTVTETQAQRMLGFPDATLVTPPFGVYAADNVQKIQLAFIKNCRDETSTRIGVQRFLEWLSESGEEEQLVKRAEGRRRIIETIAEERDKS